MRKIFYLIPLFLLLVGCSSDDEEYISNWDFVQTYWTNPKNYIEPGNGIVGYKAWFRSDKSFTMEYDDIPGTPGINCVIIDGRYDYDPPVLTVSYYGKSVVYKVSKDKMELQGENMLMDDRTDIQFPEVLFLFDNTPPEE